MFNLIFKGHLREMNQEYLPPSLRTDVLQRIKTRLNNNNLHIKYLTGDLKKVINNNIKSIKPNTFFSLSDILSFVDPVYLSQFLTRIKGTNIVPVSGVFRSFLRNDVSHSEFANEANIDIFDITEEEMTNMYKVYSFNFKVIAA
jgi:hypothetical protein